MDATDWKPLKQLFERASALPAEEQATFLEDACAGDPSKRAQLATLLTAARDADTFSDNPADAVLSLPHWANASAPEVDPDRDPLIGQTVSHYRIGERLGRGGMGVVYRAHDTRLDRTVALKFLPSHLRADAAAMERFMAEARAASALDHPNICVIHEIGEAEDGELFIAMAYYAGETLAQQLQRGPLPIEAAVEITRQVAQGLSKAHDRGIVHRDIKPANLKVTEDGIWKILDFGIARLAGSSRTTRTGSVAGTLAYVSPEQLEEVEVSPQSDLWSLGVVLYEMLAGRLPFRGATPVALLYQILHEEPDPVREIRDDVPPGLDRVVTRALAKDVAVRYGGVGELLADLGRVSGLVPEVEFPAAVGVEPEGIPAEPAVTPPPFLTPEVTPEEAVLPPFVGREVELDVLEGWLEEASAGQGRVGFITGEAGTGKTALAREFCRRAAESDDQLIVATGDCNAHTGPGDPHHPFREILGSLTADVEAQWAAGALSPDHAARLWSFLPSAARALVESGPSLVGTFLPGVALLSRADAHPSLEEKWRSALRELADRRIAGVQQTDLIDQLVRVLRSLARERPLLLVVDDLQWADAGSIAALFQLGRRLAGSRILVIGLYRPAEVASGRDGQRHPLEPVIPELSERFGEVLLEVGATGDRRFVDALVDSEPNRLGSDFRDALYGQTQGYALFTVELLRSMREQGALVRNEDGEWLEGPDLSWDRLPARVEAVIEGRMGRLPADLQRLLTIACVEGAEFTLEAAARVQGVDVQELIAPVGLELERRHRLVRTEGLQRVNGQRLSVYRFRHILFQRYLYDELTDVERAHLHEQVGEALEALYGDQTGRIAPQLARHFREAGATEKTFAYLEMAGIRARSVGAFPEAVGHFEGALDALLRLPPAQERDRRELELQLELGGARTPAALPGQEEAALRAYELARQVGSKEQLFWALSWMYWIFGHYAGDGRVGRELAEEALSLAREEGDEGLVVHGLEFAGRNAFLRGDGISAHAHYEELASIYDPEEHRDDRYSAVVDLGPCTHGTLALILWFLGYPDEALDRCEQAVASARDLQSPSTLLLMRMYLGWAHMWRMNIEPARREFEALRKRADELGLGAFYGPMMDISSGWCAAQQGEVTEGIESIRQGLTAWRAIGWKIWAAWYTALLADALRLAGRAEEGLEALKEAHAAREGCDDLCHEAEIHRILGELHLALPEPQPREAEAAFRHAIEVAQSQQAKSYELRATTSLARLLRDQGQPAEARELLAGIYGWFTEGHDTQDLIDARTLLTELSAAPDAEGETSPTVRTRAPP